MIKHVVHQDFFQYLKLFGTKIARQMWQVLMISEMQQRIILALLVFEYHTFLLKDIILGLPQQKLLADEYVLTGVNYLAGITI